jgi:serine/threonine protein kinase
MQFSPSALSSSEFTPYLLAYQLVSAVQHCHARGLVHGDLRPCNVLLTDGLWVWLTGAHGAIHATPGATALLTDQRKRSNTRSPPALDSKHEPLACATEHLQVRLEFSSTR